MTESSVQPLTQLHKDIHLASVAALAVLIWDWLITLNDEVELIWSKANNSWLKWIFLTTRYYVLASSIAGRIVEGLVIYSIPVKTSAVMVWYACEVLVAAHAMHALEILLMMRVYALYNRPRWMAIFFSLLFVLENVLLTIGIVLHLPDQETFVPIHIVSILPTSFIYFGFSNMVVQVIIMVLTVHRYKRETWKTIPIAKLVFRDGTVAFFIVSSVALLMAVYAVFGLRFATAPFPWLLVAISCVTARLITNMQKFPHGDEFRTRGGSATAIQFTTVLTNEIACEHADGFRSRDGRRTGSLSELLPAFVGPYGTESGDRSFP